MVKETVLRPFPELVKFKVFVQPLQSEKERKRSLFVYRNFVPEMK
jgi:hypothetical protein